ncbi:hypothetical protein Nmel_005724, partial [Mimus melanotis]
AADVLTKYSVKLEEMSFSLAADVPKLMDDKAMNINRALLDNEKATAKVLFNLIKSELEKEKLHHLKWQGRVKDWKFIQKNGVVQSLKEFMASEEIQNPPTVKREMENMIREQMVLSEQRLRVLQYIGCGKRWMTLLDINIYTAKDAEVVHSNMLQMTEKLKCRFE